MVGTNLSPKGTEAQLPVTVERRFSTWTEAQLAVDIQLKQPSWVPSSYWMSALQSFGADGNGPAWLVIATFSGVGESYFTVEQSEIARPEDFDFGRSLIEPAAGIANGVVAVGESTGYWRAGAKVSNDKGEFIGWDRTITSLEWQADDALYRVDGKGPELADLVRIAQSLL